MKCPNCNAEIDELTEVCPKCKINLDEFEESQKKYESESNDESSRTSMLKIVNILQIIGFIIIAITYWSKGEVEQGFIYLAFGLVIFAFIKGFSDVIDLLESINNKVNTLE